MTITLDLDPQVEHDLLAQASQKGVSLADYIREIVTREAQSPSIEQSTPRRLIDVLNDPAFRGSGLQIERSNDYPRDLEL